MSRTVLAILVALGVAAAVAFAVIALGRGGSFRFSPGLTVALSSVVGVAASWIALRAARSGRTSRTRRRRPAEETAHQLGFSYLAKPDKAFRQSFAHLPEIPRSAKFKHVLQGEIDGRALVIFQSSYIVYTGQAMMQVAHCVYAAEAPHWPVTSITRRNFLSRLMGKLGRTSGVLLENSQFNERLKLKTDDEDFAIALLGPEMQAFLLEKSNVRWRIGQGRVCLIYSGMLKPARIEASLDRMRRFWSLVPHELDAW